jgi:DNA repair protein RecN (Recombination protein N)
VLVELQIRDLGVIEQASLVLGPGMTALTGETGAGKTMLVEAIELLVGGRADAIVVRAGADEAVVEGRFLVPVPGGDPGEAREVVAARVIPRVGRSRAYLDGRLAPASALADLAAGLVDLHGQHAHQSLLATANQRRALDRFGAVDLGPLTEARAALAAVDAELASLGGDDRARARELDLLRFQVEELRSAGLADPGEEELLATEEDALADAVAHQAAAAHGVAALVDEDGAADLLGRAVGAVAGRGPFVAVEARLRSLAAELADVAHDLRAAGEGIEDDPERLEAVRARRQLLHELRRKYGETIAEVIAYAAEAEDRLAALVDHDRRAADLDAQRRAVLEAVASAAADVGGARRAAAPRFAAEVAARLTGLAMAGARVAVTVGEDDPGDEVAVLLAANPGSPPGPLAKVASGGELARAMLAVRLVLSAATGPDPEAGPSTLVFDEVDAGIGGTAALAVGEALAALAGPARQVLVVTHLAQVAAHADTQIVVAKSVRGGTTVARATVVDGAARVSELARMLAGTPDSAATRRAATELLATAKGARIP